MANRLALTNSPYLIQHANNPVDWHPWDELALQKALTEDKPIFLSIGYAACHWCHVMAHESFEDPATAAFLNQHFVNIKVDREERPDLDSIYMAATMAMTGSGGWPMSVFLTPDLKPFYCGTYFPPEPRHNMPSFKQLLEGIAQAWRAERHTISEISTRVEAHLQSITQTPAATTPLNQPTLDQIATSLVKNYDWGFGGWGGAPKFPQPMLIEFLLRRATLKPGLDDRLLKPALHALQAMARGGMYDVVGGGFARYSIDAQWRVPHFEKMLYDNAQLILVYLHAWQITADPFYLNVVTKTLNFALREMTHPSGGFYSSLDADSEHEEGKYYVWGYKELQEVLGKDFELFKGAYGLTPSGNWEGKIVLQRVLDNRTLATRLNTTPDLLLEQLETCHSRLFQARSHRVRPATDDKVLTSWNALMLQALAETANATGNPTYKSAAIRNCRFLLTTMRPDGMLKHTWRQGHTSNEVFLEDYAALINALIAVYMLDFENVYFYTALQLAREMLAKFQNPAGGFFDTPDDGKTLLLRPRDLQDNAIPSGHAQACEALVRLAALTGHTDLRARAEEALDQPGDQLMQYPTAFGRWLQAADLALGNVKQVAVVGDLKQAGTQALLAEIRQGFHPRLVIAASQLPLPEDAPELLRDHPLVDSNPAAYVCEGFVCQRPVTNATDLHTLIGG